MKILSLLIIILAIVAVIIGIVLLVVDSSYSEETGAVVSPVPTATATPTPASTSSSELDDENDSGEFLETTLSAVTEDGGSGTATTKFTDGVFTHEVVATLPDLAEGEFYEGWLVTADDSDFFSTGKMTKSGNEYRLTFTAERDYSDYPQVVITREVTDDGVPEEHVLEGNLAEMLLL